MNIDGKPISKPQPKPEETPKGEDKAKDTKGKTSKPVFSEDPVVEAGFLAVWQLTTRKAREEALKINEE